MPTSDVPDRAADPNAAVEVAIAEFADLLVAGLEAEFPPEVAPPVEPSQPRLA